MPLDVVLTMGGLVFAGIAMCWFLEGVEKQRQQHGDYIQGKREAHAVLEEHKRWEAESGRAERAGKKSATVVRTARRVSENSAHSASRSTDR